MHHPGRNEPCPCGSGQKYKRCCAGREAPRPAGPGAEVHRRDDRLSDAMLRFARRRFGAAWARDAMEVFFAYQEAAPGDLQLFMPWVLHHWPVQGRPVREWFLEERGAKLDAAERAWLEAQRAAVVSVWEVREVRPGEGLRVKDLLRGEERFVHEVMGSRQLRVRNAVLGRVVDHLGLPVFCGMHPVPLPPSWSAAVVLAARKGLKVRGGKPVPHEKLADPVATLNLVHVWQDAGLGWKEEQVLAAVRPVKLVNTDGEPLLLTRDHFDFDAGARKRVLAGLEKVDGAELEEEGVPAVYAFLKEGNAMHASWENTVVGRAEVGVASLRLETNSVKRADALRSRVEAACPGLLRFRAREHGDPMALVERLEEAGGAPPVEVSPPPEVQEALRGFMARQYEGWADSPLPALKGKTPRQAVRSAAGRRVVDTLLKELEHEEADRPEWERADFSAMRAELGLEE